MAATRLPRPWDSPGKNTGVGCHFLLPSAWKWKVKVKFLSRVRLLATPWTEAYQAPPAMGFSRREYWSGVPVPSPLPFGAHVNLCMVVHMSTCLRTICLARNRALASHLPFLKGKSRGLADCDDSLSLHSPFYFLSIMHNLAEHNLIHAEQSYVYAN